MNNNCAVASILQRQPQAVAVISGSDRFPRINGLVKFYQTRCGLIVYADINGLPRNGRRCREEIFAFHIHSGTSCTGGRGDPFADAGQHYDNEGCRHPFHAGDMPPLFGCAGRAVSVFLTDRVSLDEILERTVIIHREPDDFKTQPGGGAGERIACGVIRSVRR